MSCFRTYVSQLTLQIRQRHLDISPVELGWNIKFGALVSGHDSILLAVYLSERLAPLVTSYHFLFVASSLEFTRKPVSCFY